MALKKSKTTSEGFSVEYWRINPIVSVDYVNNVVTSKLIAYFDASARQAGKPPIEVRPSSIDGLQELQTVTLTGSDATSALATGDVRSAMYTKLKALGFFTNSEDV